MKTSEQTGRPSKNMIPNVVNGLLYPQEPTFPSSTLPPTTNARSRSSTESLPRLQSSLRASTKLDRVLPKSPRLRVQSVLRPTPYPLPLAQSLMVVRPPRIIGGALSATSEATTGINVKSVGTSLSESSVPLVVERSSFLSRPIGSPVLPATLSVVGATIVTPTAVRCARKLDMGLEAAKSALREVRTPLKVKGWYFGSRLATRPSNSWTFPH